MELNEGANLLIIIVFLYLFIYLIYLFIYLFYFLLFFLNTYFVICELFFHSVAEDQEDLELIVARRL
jgi:hypothetical protein